MELDRNAGLLSFDNVERWNRSQDRPRWRVLWLENRLDCRVWSYYCDLRRAMGTLHTMLSLSSSLSVPKQGPDLIVVGPRMTSPYRLSDPLGISRARWAHVPLVIIQNKMYACSRGEFCGDPAVKLDWAREVGAAAAFTDH